MFTRAHTTDVKSWLIGKDPWCWERLKAGGEGDDMVGARWGEGEMVGWHHWLNGHEFEQALGDGEGQGNLACCSSWGCKELNATGQHTTWYTTCDVYQDSYNLGFPGGSVIKNSPASAGDARDLGSIPGSRRSSGVGNDNPLLYSCLENLMDRGPWQATVHGVAKIRTQLSN